MFSDLVGSTALSTNMDPEDVREAITAYQTCVTEARPAFRRLRREVYGRRGSGVLRVGAP
jgi:class 3 adenylate cyclase